MAKSLRIKDKANGISLIIDLLPLFFLKLFEEVVIKVMWSSIDEMEIKQNDTEDIWVLLIQKRLG